MKVHSEINKENYMRVTTVNMATEENEEHKNQSK